jgi:16S rRNA (uracil1498-N3)-methyltransferase
MSERFFLAAAPRGNRAVLTGDEARHLSRVLRGQPGDEVVVFAGTGVEWPARIVRIARDEVELELADPTTDPARPGPRRTLAVALPKGERQKWLVEKLTELGVDRLVPLVTTRGVAEATEAARGRLERGVIEACKQCGRNRLLEIAAPQTIAALLATDAACLAIVADPHAPPLDATAVRAAGREIVGLVGPEGGFTADEIAAAERAGAIRAGLGPHVLRVETAAIALAARLAGAG